VEVEFGSAFSLKVRLGELDKAMAGQVIALFERHLAEGFYRTVPVSAPEYAQARVWLSRCETPLCALGALHLAAAVSNDLVLLTADRALAQAARDFGAKCRLIG
jgi:predicted nucleic acid-binding protein